MRDTCSASLLAPVYGVTVLCELERGHDGPHHGHIDAGPQHGSAHSLGPSSFDWVAPPPTEAQE